MDSDVWHRASLLLEARRPQDAAGLLRRRLAGAPDDARAWCQLALAELALADWTAALEAANRAVGLEPLWEWPHRLASHALLRLGDVRQGRAAAEEACRLAPEEWQTHVTLAHVLVEQQRRWGSWFTAGPSAKGRARAAARVAIQLAPHEADAHVVMGAAEMVAGRKRRAIAAYRRALTLDPDHAEAHQNLGVAELYRWRLAAALRGLVRSARRNPQADAPRELVVGAVQQLMFKCLVVLAGIDALGLALVGPASRPTRSWVILISVGVMAGWAASVLRHVPKAAWRALVRSLGRQEMSWLYAPVLLLEVFCAVSLISLGDKSALQTCGWAVVAGTCVTAVIVPIMLVTAAVRVRK